MVQLKSTYTRARPCTHARAHQVYPEFIPPTPAFNSPSPYAISAYIGRPVRLALRAQLRLAGPAVTFFVPVDPGLPTWADLSPPRPTVAVLPSGAAAAAVESNLSWTPICQQVHFGCCLWAVQLAGAACGGGRARREGWGQVRDPWRWNAICQQALRSCERDVASEERAREV
jgi:hypothetical protein